ncbi:putative HTH-type transcriptional regulator BA_1941/GBAA_1941/BAS1801 [Peribacillus sp. Bi96]|uniref:MarR family winged helix-turn-helix transcriptional regulator n=1 Tax=unclassified Peribacillus TaxID=2675266 RepID=UPI001E19360C|nr:MarR family transcriptional regulator [Peribacillus sp. Bi96]CAH0261084.1 putative HTH-type transcriptional regulator BA_1941/GBAA_1941/BAS1801 [Peribacillus sp. Bi96]
MTNSCSNESLILYKMNCLNKQISSKFESCMGISQSRHDILYQLYQADEMSQTALQKEVNIDGAAITRHLKQLEATGMIVRRKDPEDNRFTLVCLSDHGRKQIFSYQAEKARFVTLMLKDFNEEERQELTDMLTRIQKNISQV